MKNFDELVSGRKREEFQLGGQTFTTRANISGKRFARMLRRLDDAEGGEETLAAAEWFLGKVLIKEDTAKFMELMADAEDDDDEDDENVVGLQQMNAVIDWAVEHYTGKHITQDESSTAGSQSMATQPNVVSFNPKQKTKAS